MEPNSTMSLLVIHRAKLPFKNMCSDKLWSVLICQGEILSVEPTPFLEVSKAQTLDLAGKSLIPGFIDSHVHLIPFGLKDSLDLTNMRSIDDCLKELGNLSKKISGDNEWLVGYNWDNSKWTDDRYITRHDIDRIEMDRPVVLKRICSHIWTLNTEAMKRVALPSNHASIHRDEFGNPTGILFDSGHPFVTTFIPTTKNETKKAATKAMNFALKQGVTTICDFSPNLTIYKDLAANQPLPIRILCGVKPQDFWKFSKKPLSFNLKQHRLSVNSLKVLTDGSIGARTSKLRRPYTDDPFNGGALQRDSKGLDTLIERAEEVGWQVCVHAIGDAAIDVCIEAFREIGARNLSAIQKRPKRHRIEHAEMVLPSHIGWMRKLGLVASMQPNFVGQWQQSGGMYSKALGKSRANGMNAFKSILKAGVPLAFGSDGIPLSPLYGIASAMNHPDSNERLTFKEALHAYTQGSAYACRIEDQLGMIEPGMLADLVVLNRDPTNLPPDEVAEISIDSVFVDGKLANY